MYSVCLSEKVVEYGLKSILVGHNWILDRVLSKEKLELRIIVTFFLFEDLAIFLEIYKFGLFNTSMFFNILNLKFG